LADGTNEVLTSYRTGEAFGSSPQPLLENTRTSAVATSDSVLLCFDRTTLQLLRAENKAAANNGDGDGNGNWHGYHLNGNGNGGNGTHGYHGRARLLSNGPSGPKLVTLAFLSARLPAPLLSEQLARATRRQTEAAVVLVRFRDSQKATEGNGSASTPRETEQGFYELSLGAPENKFSSQDLSRVLGQLRQFQYIIFEAVADEQPAPWLYDLLVRSDLAYLFLQPKNEQVYHLERIVRETRVRGRNQGAQLKPIACLVNDEQIDGFDLLAQNVGTPIHLYIRGCPVEPGSGMDGLRPSFAADVRRLAREAGGCMLGLALSSGAAKGFAHIGVIQVLEENGIEVDVIAGASMGAYVGSIWAYGHDATECERLAREVEGKWKLWSLVDPVFPPRQGFMRGYAVKRRLERSIGNARFADLVRPMRVVATNLITLERKVFSAGQVSVAVHASVAVPGICVPVTIDGETYIDGGVMDPLPVEVLREMGVSRVIAVDAIPTPETMRHTAEAEVEKEKRARNIFKKAINIDKQLNYFARGNLFEILMRSVHGAQIRAAEASCRQADVVLRPEILDDRWLDFRHPGKFIALGREVAFRHLDELKALAEGKERVNEGVATTMAAFA
jgi:NTE family protein